MFDRRHSHNLPPNVTSRQIEDQVDPPKKKKRKIGKKMSRQRRWQVERIAEGRCSKCQDGWLNQFKTMCDVCAEIYRVRQREQAAKRRKKRGKGKKKKATEE